MKFGIIVPADGTFQTVDVADLETAERLAGLEPGRVDHGLLTPRPRLAYVIYEFAIFEPPEPNRYFAIGGTLLAGPMVLYQIDEAGNTVDFTDLPPGLPIFFPDVAAVELAIRLGRVRRPQIRINGALVWEWPNPPPEGMQR